MTDMKKELYNKRREQIGVLLRHERKFLKLDQEVIARKMGARKESISKIETGTRRIDILELIDYAEALGFSITEIAWKIETYLTALSLLPLPKRNVLVKKIRVDVSWCENRFSASLEEIGAGTIVFTADTFVELQIEVEAGLDSHIKEMVADGKKVPWWFKNKKYKFEYKFLDARALLNAYSPFISLAAISRASGINQNQLSQYANGLKKARPYQIKRIVDAIHQIGNELTAVVI